MLLEHRFDLTFDDRFEKVMDKDGIWEVHTLTIKDAVMEDAGTYEVVASNRLGENAATGTLAIVTEPPTFPVELQVIYCNQHLSILFSSSPFLKTESGPRS